MSDVLYSPTLPSPYTVAAHRSGRGASLWAQAAAMAADSTSRLPRDLHPYLASHPSVVVRRSWASRPDVPADLVSARLQVETDPTTRNRLLVSTPSPVLVPAGDVLPREGRGGLVARAMNASCPDSVAASYLSAAFPAQPTRRSRIWADVALNHVDSWASRPGSLEVLLSRTSDCWALRRIAPLCRTERLEALLFDRVVALAESPAEAVNVLLCAPLTRTLRDRVAQQYSDCADEEGAALAALVADPVATVPDAVLRRARRGPRGVYIHQVTDVISNVTDVDVVTSLYAWVSENAPYVEEYHREQLARAFATNPSAPDWVVRSAVSQMSSTTAGLLLSFHRSEISASAAAVVRSLHPGAGRRDDPRPPASRRVAHALAETIGWGFGHDVSRPLLTHLLPWLGTRMEETLTSLTSNWQGTLGELFEATAALEGVEPLGTLPRPVRRRISHSDEPPF